MRQIGTYKDGAILLDGGIDLPDGTPLYIAHSDKPCVNTGQIRAGECEDCRNERNYKPDPALLQRWELVKRGP